jgi:hypothetical protein
VAAAAAGVAVVAGVVAVVVAAAAVVLAAVALQMTLACASESHLRHGRVQLGSLFVQLLHLRDGLVQLVVSFDWQGAIGDGLTGLKLPLLQLLQLSLLAFCSSFGVALISHFMSLTAALMTVYCSSLMFLPWCGSAHVFCLLCRLYVCFVCCVNVLFCFVASCCFAAPTCVWLMLCFAFVVALLSQCYRMIMLCLCDVCCFGVVVCLFARCAIVVFRRCFVFGFCCVCFALFAFAVRVFIAAGCLLDRLEDVGRL